MITSTKIYWLLMLDNIKMFSSVICVIFFIIGCIILQMSVDDNSRGMWLWWIGHSLMFCFLLVFSVLIPNTKQMAIILVAPKVINNEQVQKLPNQVLILANEWLEELRPKGEK